MTVNKVGEEPRHPVDHHMMVDQAHLEDMGWGSHPRENQSTINQLHIYKDTL